MEKTAGNSFAYCLVDDVKHNENDFERRVPIKIAFLGVILIAHKTIILIEIQI